MKKLFFIFLVVVPIFYGCSKDDESEITPFTQTSMSMYAEDTYELFDGDIPNVSSSNNFIASISTTGILTANHVGTAEITDQISKCQVTVKPRYTLYPDPYVKWDASVSEVKSVCGAPYSETPTSLIYHIGASTIVSYMFKNGKLSGAGVTVSTAYTSELSSFLLERYKVISVNPSASVKTMYANANSMEDATVIIGTQLPNNNIWMVIYMPNTL